MDGSSDAAIDRVMDRGVLHPGNRMLRFDYRSIVRIVPGGGVENVRQNDAKHAKHVPDIADPARTAHSQRYPEELMILSVLSTCGPREESLLSDDDSLDRSELRQHRTPPDAELARQPAESARTL
eukprot:497632-Rhodomonas_salina.5